MKAKVFLSALVLGLTMFMTSCSKDKEDPKPDPDTIEVVFEDALLATFVKEQLGLTVSAKITQGNIKKLTELTIRGALTEVKSLKGLEHATELTIVDFGANPVSDLTPIKDLKKVTYLRFNETPVTDLTPLKDYTTLTYFNANQAGGVTDISPLSKNVNLMEMILRGNPLGNRMFETIAGFTKLHRLNIRSTGISDVTVVGQLMSKGALLKTTPGYMTDSELDLRGNSITDYSPIQTYIDNGTAITVTR